MENVQRFLCTECGSQLTVANGDRTCPNCGNQMVQDLVPLVNSLSGRSTTPASSRSEAAAFIRGGEGIPQSLSENAGGSPSGTNATVEFQSIEIFPTTTRLRRHSFTIQAPAELNTFIESTNSGPPPLPAEKISQLPTTHVGAEDAEQQKCCTICREDFRQEESVCQLPCSHLFHQHCVKYWLGRHGTCPNCRLSLTDKHEASNISRENAEFAADIGSVNGAGNGESADTNYDENVDDGSGDAG